MLIATLPPLHPRMNEIVDSPAVNALRFNTGVRTPWKAKETIERLLGACGDKPLFLDLKARQLRIVKWADPAYEEIELNHQISLDVPATIHFRDHTATIVAVNGNKIFLNDKPEVALGAGQSVNILDPSLKIHGYFTRRDEEYIEAAQKLGCPRFMLSFVEELGDIVALLKRAPKAKIVAKIESLKGLAFVRGDYKRVAQRVSLMAARDDLYAHLGDRKVDIFKAEQDILSADPDAIAASRILTSLERSREVALGDLKDLHALFSMGYRHFMLSDTLCSHAYALREAFAVWEQFVEQWEKSHG